MFKRILIANRGEIAVAIIRSCRELGIETVAIYSEADRQALHVQLADTAICVGPAAVRDSYLNVQAILTAASISGAEAIHPGFGFLSENADFSYMVSRCGFKFIGPSANVIRNMGDKSKARQTAIEADVPVVPGTVGEVSSFAEATKACEEIGYPVMIKASAGGGGRGMRIANKREDLSDAFSAAKAEAMACFGNDGIYLERFIRDPRHIEIQLLADEHGHVIHLGDRDCSIQRRNQKMLEEATSPFSDDELRKQMGAAAIRIAKKVNYSGVGTIEFLVDEKKHFYFMEMNTRIQVEHPITEEITRVDLIKEQIMAAAGYPLNLKQKDIKFNGHAIECRINAENPSKNFQPNPGTITSLHLPGGKHVRVDSAIYQGYTIPSEYDSLIAKVIVWGEDREIAIVRMRRALLEFQLEGIESNIDFHLAILRDSDFIAGRYDIGYLGKKADYFLDRLKRYQTK